MAEPRKPILRLDTLVERAIVEIDGEHYELKNGGEFSLLDYLALSKKADLLRDIVLAHGEGSDAEAADLEATLDWLCRRVLMAPDEIHARLSINHRLAVVQAFTNLQRETKAPAAGEETAPLSTGESSSHDSSASMAATP